MKCFLGLIVLLFSTGSLQAQWSEDFSDNNLEGWNGDVDHFIVNASHQLQLNAPTGSTTSTLLTSVPIADSVFWQVYFRLAFAPSNTNQLRIFLGLDTNDLSVASGYLLHIGMTGDQDAIDFKFLDHGEEQHIASSSPGLVASDPVEMILRIIKDKKGKWSFYQLHNETPELLFTADHVQSPLSQLNRFGFFVRYSDTRRDKFFIDNIIIGSTLPDTIVSTFQIAAPKEMLITEIMADPTPAVNLPEAEYIEFYNVSNTLFRLSDYSLKVGNTKRYLPDSLLRPGEFVIITDASVAYKFQDYGTVIAIDNFPSLVNGGADLMITDNAGAIIDVVNYSDAWYRDENKSSGGWSLELINPFHLCAEAENWMASSNWEGGTPGKFNSNWSEAKDEKGPIFQSVFTNDNRIELQFNEALDSMIMVDESLYRFEPQIEIEEISVIENRTVIISVSNALLKRMSYSLFPFEGYDCLGNSALTDTVVFGVAEQAMPGDILINEILFNPKSGGSRFIELVNASDKFIDLSELAIGRRGSSEVYRIVVREIMGPGHLIVFTEDRDDILARYHVANPGKLFSSELPSWDEQEDNASVIAHGMIIDSLTYSSMWHHPVVADQNGVSLERVSAVAVTHDQFNWHSASSLSGYGTPTGENSQYQPVHIIQSPLSITHKHFSPNNDGFNDFLLIKFELDSGSDVGSIWVYDTEGREIFQILSNETIGKSAMIQWDGRVAEGVVAHPGIYLIFVELWDTTGRVRHFQESVALVNR